MNVTSPCKDCTNRAPSCHSKCEKYQAFRRELTEKNEHIRELKRLENLTAIKREKSKWR